MLLRRIGLLSLAMLAAACAPGVDKTPGPTEIDTAVFDVTSAVPQIPQPNDLVLTSDVSGLPVPDAQKDLLREFQKAGGFPNDQEVAITIDFQSTNISSSGLPTSSAPDLDLTTVIPGQTVVVIANATGVGGGVSQATLEPVTAADYSKGTDRGTLTLHNKGHLRWTAGAEYIVGVRGGPNGVKLTNGHSIAPSSTTFLLIQDKDLSKPENETLIQLQLGSRVAAAAAGAQLEALRQGVFVKAGAFDAVDTAFPHKELALLQTFKVAPLGAAHVETDPAAGKIPLPSDFLLDPANGGKTVVFNTAFGPAAAGLATLDGFSTTAMILAPTSNFVDARTVTKDNVFLYELTAAGPVLVDPATYETEPSAITATPANTTCGATGPCFSPTIGLQPAAPAVSNNLTSKPLKEKTEYGVIITNRVKDLGGLGLSRSTIGKLLLFTSPLATGTTSNLIGIPPSQAVPLESMRQAVAVLVQKATADHKITGSAEVAMAYTFRTQSITADALNLGAAPYAKLPAATGVPFCATPSNPTACIKNESPAAAFDRFGVDKVKVPFSHLAAILEVQIITLNLLDPATGAFRSDQTVCANPDPTQNPCLEFIKANVAVPNLLAAGVTPPPLCPDGSGLRCAPLVVFRHGINGGRGQMLPIADTLAASGMVTVAIDANKQGERAYCSQDAECVPGFKCISDATLKGQADKVPPGYCQAAGTTASAANLGKNLLYRPVLCPIIGNCPTYDPTNQVNATGGVPVNSGEYLISVNFFRTRDSFRQDILDESQLIRVMAPLTTPAANTHLVYEALKTAGIQINPAQVYYVGQSLGAINGTVDAAVNPRISKVALNVGGGTVVDTYTNSPSFSTQIAALLASVGIDKAKDPAGYLQFLSVAKWILDPADPINFAQYLKLKPLPNLLANPNGSVPQTAKKVLGQRAQCDSTVPDLFEVLLANNIGLSPLSQTTATVTVFTTDQSFTTPLTCPPFAASPGAGVVSHAFLTNFTNVSLTNQAQADIANFFLTDALPAPVRIPAP